MKKKSTNTAPVIYPRPVFVLSLMIVLNLGMKAQDTLFYEGFNDWPVYMSNIYSIFMNYDEDMIPDANDFPGGWTVGNFGNGGSDKTEIVAMSSSWLQGFAEGNRNFLRLPGIFISGSTTTLSWRSAPALGNLYMDGYTVAVSTDSAFYKNFTAADTDTLMHFAQNTNNNENSFSPGIMHTSFDTAAPVSPAGITQYPGKLMKWEVDLSQYAGKTIYLVFLHNSDDDNFLALDDILVHGSAPLMGIPGGRGGESKNTLSVFPNPGEHIIEFSSDEGIGENTLAFIYNSAGQFIMTKVLDSQKTRLDISGFAPGVYYVTLLSGPKQQATSFIRK